MKNSDDLMLVPGSAGYEAWRNRSRGGEATPDPDAKGRRAPGWIALPTRSVVCVPMMLQGTDATRREASARLELEAAGLANEATGTHHVEFLPVGTAVAGREQQVLAVMQAGNIPDDVLANEIDSQYAPSVLFHSRQARVAQLWREQNGWVLTIPNEDGALVYCQAISAKHLDDDAGAEIRCILAALEVSGMLPRLDRLAVAFPDGMEREIDPGFAAAIDLPVEIVGADVPISPQAQTRLVPDVIVQQRLDRTQRRMTIMAVSGMVLVLLAALGAFGGRLYMRQKHLRAENVRLDELEPVLNEIRNARQTWTDLEGALRRDLYPVELYHQLMTVLPAENIRITKFEAREDAVSLSGEATSLGHAIDFRGVLVNHPGFKNWNFDEGFPQPINDPNTGTATFTAEGRRLDMVAAPTKP